MEGRGGGGRGGWKEEGGGKEEGTKHDSSVVSELTSENQRPGHAHCCRPQLPQQYDADTPLPTLV